MSATLLVHERFLEHQPGIGHPERPARLEAMLARIRARPGISDALDLVTAEPAADAALTAVHAQHYLDVLAEVDAAGGGRLDADTAMSPASLDAARRGAGAGLQAIGAVESGADFAFCMVRPPGHHAVPDRAMGFCLLNNVAVAAASLRARGERVAIVDWDAHHGNGTQDAFDKDPGVLFVSLHEYPQYPGTGRLDEVGTGAGVGTTLNLPFPHGTGERTYLAAFDEVIAPVVAGFAPDWLLVSCGFDAHRADPLTDLGLRATSYRLLAARARQLAADVCAGRLILFLEGGYDLEALADSIETTLAGLLGVDSPVEEPAALDDRSPLACQVVARSREIAALHWDF